MEKMTMIFSLPVCNSEEQVQVKEIKENGNIIIEDGFEFDKYGKCLNDNTWGGAKRTLVID